MERGGEVRNQVRVRRRKETDPRERDRAPPEDRTFREQRQRGAPGRRGEGGGDREEPFLDEGEERVNRERRGQEREGRLRCRGARANADECGGEACGRDEQRRKGRDEGRRESEKGLEFVDRREPRVS